MISLLLGVGEIGSAYYEILSPHYTTYRLDIRPELSDEYLPEKVDILHVCLRYSDGWEAAVNEAIDRFEPSLINVMTTTPPGTTEKLGPRAVHSTSRGLHPHLKDGILATPKHVGGPQSEEVAEYFRAAGLECITHPFAKTTELAHLLSNAQYATAVLFADEMEKICRYYGTDYFETVMLYAQSHNKGYRAMGLNSKLRAILTPPYGKPGGHCIALAGELLDEEAVGPQIRLLREVNK